MSIKAMKQALEALEHAQKDAADYQRLNFDQTGAAITALRTAIAEAEKQEPVAWITAGRHTVPLRITPPAAQQEPVAWANINKHGDITHTNNKRMPWSKTPLYTTPPAAQHQWVGLTTEDMLTCINEPAWDLILRKAEQILREKNQ